MEEQFVDAAEGEETTVSNIPKIRKSALTLTDAKNESEIWNPMGVHYFCKDNQFGISPVLAKGFSFIGQSIFNLKPTPAPINLSEVPCQIFDGISCWRTNCPFAHEKLDFGSSLFRKRKAKSSALPVQQQIKENVPINYITNLQEKKIAPVDCIMEVNVTYAKNPWEFYVNCERGWGCCLVDKLEETFTRKELEAKLTEELLQDSNFETLMCPEYIQFQLVAVMRIVAGTKIFVRGMVREATDNEFLDKEHVKVQLLDTGEKLLVKRTLICGLPKLYIDNAPVLAYRCCLFGISALMNQWTDEASRFFRKLIMGKKCILIVKKSIKATEEAPPIFFEDLDPYQVELRTTCPELGSPKYHDIAKLLAKCGHGVLWARNLFHIHRLGKEASTPP